MNTQGMIPAKENANKKISDRYQKKTYAKGATCIYGDTLYRAKADITTAEEWTAAHWEETNMETIRAEMAAEVSSLNANIQPHIGECYIDFVMSQKPVHGGIAYVSTSVYLPKEYGMTLKSAIAVGAYGDFASFLDLQRWGDYYRLSTTNANLAGYMIQAQVTIA